LKIHQQGSIYRKITLHLEGREKYQPMSFEGKNMRRDREKGGNVKEKGRMGKEKEKMGSKRIK
jgi:hypothetical protein